MIRVNMHIYSLRLKKYVFAVFLYDMLKWAEGDEGGGTGYRHKSQTHRKECEKLTLVYGEWSHAFTFSSQATIWHPPQASIISFPHQYQDIGRLPPWQEAGGCCFDKCGLWIGCFNIYVILLVCFITGSQVVPLLREIMIKKKNISKFTFSHCFLFLGGYNVDCRRLCRFENSLY